MKIVIADAGPVIHLAEAKALHALSVLGEVIIPQAVSEEIATVLGQDGWRSGISIQPLTASQLRQAQIIMQVAGLHRGEAQVIALAQTMMPAIILSDDAAARLHATHLGVEVRGSLGLVLASYSLGKSTYRQTQQALQNLKDSSLWLSPVIFGEALDALQSMAHERSEPRE